MKVQARVFQLIKWEDRNKYFWALDWHDDGEYDLLHCGVECKIPLREDIIGFFASIFNKKYGKGVDQDAMMFNSEGGFPIWVKRPHEFKLNDLVEVEITVKPVQSQNLSKVNNDV